MNKGLRGLKSLKGFTLTELLVVIAIIGILATIVTVSYVGYKKRARDAERISDLTQVAAALELYKADEHQYPSVSGASDISDIARFDSLISNLVTNNYLENRIDNIDISSTFRKGYTLLSGGAGYYLRFTPEVLKNVTWSGKYYIKNGSECSSSCTSM